MINAIAIIATPNSTSRTVCRSFSFLSPRSFIASNVLVRPTIIVNTPEMITMMLRLLFGETMNSMPRMIVRIPNTRTDPHPLFAIGSTLYCIWDGHISAIIIISIFR